MPEVTPQKLLHLDPRMEFLLSFFFFLPFCHAYTKLLGLLSVSYSSTIKLLTVWLIVLQFDFGWAGGGGVSQRGGLLQRCGEKVADTCALLSA